jgi:hypothetical protein
MWKSSNADVWNLVVRIYARQSAGGWHAPWGAPGVHGKEIVLKPHPARWSAA